jgi:dynein heavy chain, axonemal
VSNDIEEKQAVAEKTQVELDEARVHYTPCGTYNAVLFFCIRDMAGADPMYQNSLSWFQSLFVRSIQASDKTDDVTKRLSNINNHNTYALYQNTCRCDSARRLQRQQQSILPCNSGNSCAFGCSS